MMYNDKMVCCLKANGKVLREFKDTVYVSYGSEYSILLKNLNVVRAIVNITIDGKDVAPGGLVINAGTEIDLERFIGDNLNEGHCFKFIERTSKIEDHRGIKAEDGIIRIEFQWEKVEAWKSNSVMRGFHTKSLDMTQYGSTQTKITAQAAHQNEVGITVPGSVSAQQFTSVRGFPLVADKHVIVFRLLGKTAENMVQEPVTVKTKQECPTCGKVNKATSKFCTDCGTGLTIIT